MDIYTFLAPVLSDHMLIDRVYQLIGCPATVDNLYDYFMKHDGTVNQIHVAKLQIEDPEDRKKFISALHSIK